MCISYMHTLRHSIAICFVYSNNFRCKRWQKYVCAVMLIVRVKNISLHKMTDENEWNRKKWQQQQIELRLQKCALHSIFAPGEVRKEFVADNKMKRRSNSSSSSNWNKVICEMLNTRTLNNSHWVSENKSKCGKMCAWIWCSRTSSKYYMNQL